MPETRRKCASLYYVKWSAARQNYCCDFICDGQLDSIQQLIDSLEFAQVELQVVENFTEDQACDIIMQIMMGLNYLHL